MVIAVTAISWATWVLLVPVGLVGAFVVLLLVVALVEKMPLSPFGGEEVRVDPGQMPPYLNAMNEAAAHQGFVYGGTFRHVNGGTYQVVSSFWFSPDRRTILQVAGGTIAKIPSRTSILTSRTADGQLLITRDEVTITDLSGVADVRVVVHADFDELWSAHVGRLQHLGERVWTFEQPSPREADLETDLRRVTAMVERGLARWTGESRTAFRYTLKGAIRITTTQFFGQFVKHKSQRERFSRPRPGDRSGPPGFPVQPVPDTRLPSAVRPTPSSGLPAWSDRDFLP